MVWSGAARRVSADYRPISQGGSSQLPITSLTVSKDAITQLTMLMSSCC